MVRVRFAPSPTGYVHVGSLRTALTNFLFARKHNGVFVLRVEDTDQKRYVDGAVDNLIQMLRWAGLDYDEGPGKDGGFGPYFQSERTAIYRKYVQQLLDSGAAYPCFCSAERLADMREKQKAAGETPKYDGRCRSLGKAEVQQRMDAGEPYVIRLKVPQEGVFTFTDLIRGEVSIPWMQVDDQVLVKSDGFPTYHLANVVDDHLMEISHVIRGEEWLPSVPKHLLTYQALGWEPPQMAHLPLLLNADRSKLSKRQGDVAVEDYQKHGYLPQALVNFVGLLGWHPEDDNEILSLAEMTDQFALEKVSKSGAVFDLEKLKWMNGVYIREADIDEITERALPFFADAGMSVSQDLAKKIMLAIREKIDILEDIPKHAAIFFASHVDVTDASAQELIALPESQQVFRALTELIEQEKNIDAPAFKKMMKQVQKQTGVRGKNLFMPVRIALTGAEHGPDLALSAEIFGQQKLLQFLKGAMQ